MKAYAESERQGRKLAPAITTVSKRRHDRPTVETLGANAAVTHDQAIRAEEPIVVECHHNGCIIAYRVEDRRGQEREGIVHVHDIGAKGLDGPTDTRSRPLVPRCYQAAMYGSKKTPRSDLIAVPQVCLDNMATSLEQCTRDLEGLVLPRRH